MPVISANMTQVEELFKQILKEELQLNPESVLKLKKLSTCISKAIANAFIQCTTNVDLITTELMKKKCSN